MRGFQFGSPFLLAVALSSPSWQEGWDLAARSSKTCSIGWEDEDGGISLLPFVLEEVAPQDVPFSSLHSIGGLRKVCI